MTSKILFVDDDPNLLAAIQRNLRKLFVFDTALGGEAGLETMRNSGPYAVLVVDMQMPGMNGLEFLERAAALAPDAVPIMLTGNADQKTAVDALNRGQVFRFLNKPCPPDRFLATLETALKHFEMLQTERELLEGTLTGSVKILSEILGTVVPDALGQGQRLRESIRQFALAINAKPVWELEIAALLSSIGYTLLPVRLLEKVRSGALFSAEEERIVRRLPQVGHDLLVGIPRLNEVARVVLYQNKSFDGTGFPYDDCSGEQIPRGARMLKILLDRLRLEISGVDRQGVHRTMKGRSGTYDTGLLDRSFDCIDRVLSGATSGEGAVRSYPVCDLVPGMIVNSDILTSEGVMLLGSGNLLTLTVIQRLRNYEELGILKHPLLMQDGGTSAARSRAA